MSKDTYSIKVSNLSKSFKLPHEKISTLKGLFTNFSRNKGYEKQVALKNINFSVKEGEFFGIVGRNGSGKSTLLKILAGIYQPTAGSISMHGRVVPFIELGVGFNAELTGRENVFLNGALLGFSEKETAQKYKEIVEFAELERFMDQRLKNYSSGMQVRLAFSVATILAESDILLIDEVLAVGDASFQRKCYEYFNKVKKEKKTVVFVTHDMSAVRQYCDRAMLIDGSEMVEIGDPDNIARKYSQLFVSEEQKSIPAKKGIRWGDGKVLYQKIQVEGGADSREIKIECRVKAASKIEGVFFGFSIKDETGQSILGSNTQIKGVKAFNLKKNDEYNISWYVTNVFGDGAYFIEVTAVHNGGTEVSDWWEGAEAFTIRKEEIVPYIIHRPIKIKAKKL